MSKSTLPSIFFGFMLIACGSLWLLSNLVPAFAVDFGMLWPVFVLLPGLFLWLLFIMRRHERHAYGLLIPANILVTLAIVFFINMFVSRYGSGNIWLWTSFMYPGSVALSFFIAWIVSRRRALLIPAIALSFVSIVILVFTVGIDLIGQSGGRNAAGISLALLLVCCGLFSLVSPLWMLLFRDINGKFWGKSEAEWKEWGESFGDRIKDAVDK